MADVDISSGSILTDEDNDDVVDDNSGGGGALSDEKKEDINENRIDEAFDKWWPDNNKDGKHYVCPQIGCNKKYLSRILFEEHVTKHNGVRWSCNVGDCHKQYRSKRTLKRHIAKVHVMGPSQPIVRPRCELCQKEFASKQTLYQHKKSKSHQLVERLYAQIPSSNNDN